MATLVVRRPSGATVGDHYRFIGIEWTSDASANIGRLISTEGTDHIVFDRNGYLYHGRVKALADSAREGGLDF